MLSLGEEKLLPLRPMTGTPTTVVTEQMIKKLEILLREKFVFWLKM